MEFMLPSSAAHPVHAAATGFLLLTLNNVEARYRASSGEPLHRTQGQLALECVTLATENSEQDVWLVLRIGSYETPIVPAQVIRHARSAHVFEFESVVVNPSDNKKWALRLPSPTCAPDIEDLETFEVVLSQYATLEEVELTSLETELREGWTAESPPEYESLYSPKRPVPPIPVSLPATPPPLPPRIPPPLPPRSRTAPFPSSCNPRTTSELRSDDDLRGQLVLVDESDGHILGSLGEQFRLREDPLMHTRGHEKDPVIIDIPDIPESPASSGSGKMPTDVYVHPVPLEQQDVLMKSASLISRGLVFATDTLVSGMNVASSFFISHTSPRTEPLVFSERTRDNVRRVHSFSGRAVVVTSKTTNLIHEAIEKAVDYVGGADKNRNRRKKGTETDGQLPLKTRILLSADMLLTTVERSATHLIENGTARSSEALGHRYGSDAGNAALLMGQTARNVGIVYIDARGVGRRALLKKAGKRYLKAKLGKRDVVLASDEQATASTQGGS